MPSSPTDDGSREEQKSCPCEAGFRFKIVVDRIGLEPMTR